MSGGIAAGALFALGFGLVLVSTVTGAGGGVSVVSDEGGDTGSLNNASNSSPSIVS